MTAKFLSLINTLKKNHCGSDPLHIVLADGIYDAVYVDKLIPLGAALPKQTELVQYTGMNSSKVKQMIARLKERGLVETNGSRGSRIVPVLPEKFWVREAKKELAEVNTPRIRLDREVFEDSGKEAIGFSRLLNSQKEVFKSVKTNLCTASAIPCLLDVCAELIRESTGTAFCKEEVDMVPDRNLLIISICEKFMSRRGIWVLPRGSLKETREKISEAKRDFEYVLSDDKGINTDDLERICGKFSVEILHIDLTSPVRPDYFSAPERIEKLLMLQKIHDFKIVIEYNYPDEGISSGFLKEFFPCSKDFVVLIRSFSIFDQELNRLTMVAASRKTVRGLSQLLLKKGSKIAPELGYAVISLYADGQLAKREVKVREIMASNRNEVVNELLSYGKWKSRGIMFSNGNSMYLEPLNGYLPDNAIALLAAENIDVVDSKLYDLPMKFKKGIIIGIGKYADKMHHVDMIKILNICANKLIIGSED